MERQKIEEKENSNDREYNEQKIERRVDGF